MEKPNFLQFLKEQNASEKFNAEELAITITVALAIDENLYLFFAKCALAKLTALGVENPTDEQIAEEMQGAISCACKNLDNAIGAYDLYLKVGDVAIMLGLLGAIKQVIDAKAI